MRACVCAWHVCLCVCMHACVCAWVPVCVHIHIYSQGEGTGEGHDQEGRSGVDNDRDGDLSSSSRKELAGTHGQHCGGSYCPNQLIMCIFRHSGLITEIKCFVMLFLFFQFYL